MTTDPDALAPDRLELDDHLVRRTSARLDLLARELEHAADVREPDVGQHLAGDRLADPLRRPAHDLVELLRALSEAVVATSRTTTAADGDAAALSRLLLRELR